jgi:hypothetical protein
MTEGPDAERDTTARDDFDRPDDSTVDWNTSTNEPTGPAPQHTPSRDDDEAGQPAARQHPWQFDPSRTTFRDRSDPYGGGANTGATAGATIRAATTRRFAGSDRRAVRGRPLP